MAQASSNEEIHRLVTDFGLRVAKARVEIHELLSELLKASAAGSHAHHEPGAGGGHGHDGHHEHSAHPMYELYKVTVYHFIIDMFNLIGVGILCFAALGIIPGLLTDIVPAMFWRVDPHLAHGKYLQARMQLGRGIMLAMDFMVASDILETLLGTPGIWNIFKILCIVAVRSWLGYERYTEVHHMEKEYHEWESSFRKLPEENHSLNESFSSLVREGSFNSMASFGNAGSSRSLQKSDSFITKFRVNGADLATKIENTFEALDTNRDGRIDEAELRVGLQRMGIIISEVKIKHMMGGQETMSFDVFNTFIRRLALAESFAESIAEGHETETSSLTDDSFRDLDSEGKKDK